MLHRFHCRVTASDMGGYFYTRWDEATPVVVDAADRSSAREAVFAVMGPVANPGWTWAVQIDRIEPVPTCCCQPRADA